MISVAMEENRVQKKMLIECLSDEDIIYARKQFSDCVEKGMVLGSFDDDRWIIDNQIQTYTIQVAVDAQKYKDCLGPLLHMGEHRYVLLAKSFLTFLLGSFNAAYIRDVCKTIVTAPEIFEAAQRNDYSFISENNAMFFDQFVDFFRILPVPNRSKAIDSMIDSIASITSLLQKRPERRRILKDFVTYYRFDSVLSDFWKVATDEEKLTYFPVYLWWTVTSVIPTRVTEFTVTPRDCLVLQENGPYIKLRKTKGKKKRGGYEYNLDNDYELHTYPIPQSVAEEISWYLEESKALKAPDNGTLFCRDFRGGNCWKHMTAKNFQTLLAKYYRYILQGKFGLAIVSDDEMNRRLSQSDCPDGGMGDMEIGLIQPGDTRHIAMINALLSTHSLYICKTLAGHEDIHTAAWYADNIEMLVRSAVFEEVHRLQMNGMSKQAAVLNLYKAAGFGENVVSVSNTTGCVSKKLGDGDYDDCLAVSGDCSRCQFRRSLAPATESNTTIRDISGEIQTELALLRWELEKFRKGVGCDESIDDVLAGIQRSASKYRKSFIQILTEKDNED